MKALKKILEKLLSWILMITFVLTVTYFVMPYMLDEEEYAEIKEYVKPYAEKCVELFEKVKEWCTDTFKNLKERFLYNFEYVKDWCTNTFNNVKKYFQKENVTIKGNKLSEMGISEFSEYPDFTVPENWDAILLDADELHSVISVYNENVMSIMYLENVAMNEPLNDFINEKIDSLEKEYIEYDFSSGKTINNRIGLINAESNDFEMKMCVALVIMDEKTLIISYLYATEVATEAEAYLEYMLGEISQSIK